MCDYSLMAIPNRLAVSGEELVIHRFEAGSVGLASVFDLRSREDSRKPECCGLWSTIKAFFVPRMLNRSRQYASRPVPGC